MKRQRTAARLVILLAFLAVDARGQEPAAPAPDSTPARSDPASFAPSGLQAAYTWLPSYGDQGLGIHEMELGATFSFPIFDAWAPVRVTPAFAVRLFDGPQSSASPGRPDLPSQVYDASLDIGWRPRLAEWLFADVGITPGLYSDFTEINEDSFRLRGRALGIVALSKEFQIVAGLLYVNRLETKLLPAGGILWQPDEDTKLELVFPQPKVARRIGTTRNGQWWAHIAGEFGGGTWTVERANGQQDTADYRDIRVLTGLECVTEGGPRWRAEVGYVFSRRVAYPGVTPDFNASDTILLRAGLCY